MSQGPGKQEFTELILGPRVAQLKSFTLKGLSPGIEPSSVEVGASALSFGQSEANAVRSSDSSVSRFHFELFREKDALMLRDLSSTNGTCIEGVFVREARLFPGQHIRAGRVELVVETDSTPSRVEAYPDAQFGKLVGGSIPMRMLFALIQRAAKSDVTVLISGESGTGKELVAEEIHAHSGRAGKPFVIIDCGALPEDLIESELFGHEKGAFTGATGERPGAFEAAHGGTLFLDEIGELPLHLQPKLLRALESRTIKRVGANERRKVDVRFVAASNRNLRSEVNEGAFREDLFWRLSVLELRIPPLRERREDIATLIEALWTRTGLVEGAPVVSQEQMVKLSGLPWRGNVRELRNFVERSAVLGAVDMPTRTIEAPTPSNPQTVPDVHTEMLFKEAKEQWVNHFERSYLEERLLMASGNLSRLAREASIDRAHLLKLLKKHGLR